MTNLDKSKTFNKHSVYVAYEYITGKKSDSKKSIYIEKKSIDFIKQEISRLYPNNVNLKRSCTLLEFCLNGQEEILICPEAEA